MGTAEVVFQRSDAPTALTNNAVQPVTAEMRCNLGLNWDFSLVGLFL